MTRWTKRLLALAIGPAILMTAAPAGALGEIDGEQAIQLRRWTGAEAGWAEIMCLADPAMGPGCLTFAGYVRDQGHGTAQAIPTGRTYTDPDGVDRAWTARTGNRLFRLTIPGTGPDYAYLKGWGTQDPFTGGTVSFALYVPFLPPQPIELFRHGAAPRTVSVHLTPVGGLAVTSAGLALDEAKSRVTPGRWHTMSLSYATEPGSTLTMVLNGAEQVRTSLPLGGPVGDVHVGIVAPVAAAVAVGIDDYVETAVPNAPIHGARINYLLPNGPTGQSGWNRNYNPKICRDAAENWQMVAEDTGVRVDTPEMSWQCSLTDTVDTHLGGVTTTQAGVVDRYQTEGLPSRHGSTGDGLAMSGPYLRDLTQQPRPEDRILGVRPRVRAYTKAGRAVLNVGIVDGQTVTNQAYQMEAGNTTQLGRWGVTQPVRHNGAAWDAESLGQVDLQIESAAVTSRITVFSVRLDYVWVPA